MLGRTNIRQLGLLVGFLGLIAPGCAQTKPAANPCSKTDAIKIVTAPRAGAGPNDMGLITGCTGMAQPASYRVVIYSHTDKWYVQPYVAAPKTTINSDGTWRVQIHLGSEYAALIVKPAYDPPATSIGLPSPDGNNVLAVSRKEAQ